MSKGIGMNTSTLWKTINWMDREVIVELLEEQACIQCYDDEPTQELRQALFDNVMDGTITIPEEHIVR